MQKTQCNTGEARRANIVFTINDIMESFVEPPTPTFAEVLFAMSVLCYIGLWVGFDIGLSIANQQPHLREGVWATTKRSWRFISHCKTRTWRKHKGKKVDKQLAPWRLERRTSSTGHQKRDLPPNMQTLKTEQYQTRANEVESSIMNIVHLRNWRIIFRIPNEISNLFWHSVNQTNHNLIWLVNRWWSLETQKR